MMKYIFLFLVIFPALTAAQPLETLATSTLRNFTTADLSPEVREAWMRRDTSIASLRRQFAAELVNETLLEIEAKASGTPSAKLLEQARAKVPNPTDAEITSVFNANSETIGGRSLAEVRPAIVAFLRREPEEKAVKAYLEGLARKHSLTNGKDINAPGLVPGDVIFSAGGRVVKAADFENNYRIELNEAKADFYIDVRDDLEVNILYALAQAEAAALKVDTPTYIGREITDKLVNFTDEEQARLQRELRAKLFTKFRVEFLLKVPPPIIQNISADDDPFTGPAAAPITVVWFGDYQCSTCGKVYPILKSVVAEFPGKVRFVARDFPLENIHENAFSAAMAAGAANAQGKFWEYSELLYQNQKALDPVSLRKYATQLGLNPAKFGIDLTAETIAAEIKKDQADGSTYGVTGTPTIFVNGARVRGLSADDFRHALKAAISAAAKPQ